MPPSPNFSTNDRIRPWADDPRYWQFHGRPILLVGGSREDNLFQIPDLEAHLDTLVAAGGNYIRNTMSDRDPGDAHAFLRLPDGRYDLDQWNPEYWERLQTLLRLTQERGVIVQIEVWDRFDLSREPWQAHPMNPANALQWTSEGTGLATVYPEHPSKDRQPFFHSLPGLRGYDSRLDVVRAVQEKFVAELLRHTFPCDNVLYCMNNETSGEPAWGRYWMEFIRSRAAEAGVDVYCTDMFDDAFRPEESPSFGEVLSIPELYDFVEISQVNSRNFGVGHWRRIRWTCEKAHATGRPVNHTKIYSDGQTGWGSGTPQDGVERMWRNLLAGSAAVRFHRPNTGLGLSPLAQACLRSVRLVERTIPFWNLRPDDQLVDSSQGLAYAASTQTGEAVIFLPTGVPVALKWPENSPTICDWISVATGARVCQIPISPTPDTFLNPPLTGPMVAVLQPKQPLSQL